MPSFLGPLVGALGLCLLSAGCIITTSEDGDGSVGSDSGDPPPTSGQPSDSSGTSGGSIGPTTDEPTTGGPQGECTDNLVLDPGFEAGTPSEAWNEASELFGTPICDASCTDEPGAEPYSGSWWAWFGGDADEPDSASLSQSITISPETAHLSFWFQIRSGANTGDDVFMVNLDGQTIFMANDLEMPDFVDYTRVELDVSDWADGGTYELSFESTHLGTGLTSFFLDDVSLVTCTMSEGTGSSGATEGQDETAGSGTDTGTTGSGTDTGTTGSGTDTGTTGTGSSG
ncbi:hypothetical protein [Paraliomyxa miuraensis]|uniref:hypothetical protein n=1 Tax=Paraliomyxa miuraensis TaxID=376150 RepID=UPI00225BFE67|nr:hypothetical protein [Paraliomyxa miuraensis]MCX4244822.1 hypothetical protein [Paraliomyxa miuraensis]